MKRTVAQATGTARYDKETGKLTITTNAKRGKKIVPLTVVYAVADVCPDPRVANPAYSLTKDDDSVYHVAWNEWGPNCSCPHHIYRGEHSGVHCKHILSLVAIGLLNKGDAEC